MEFIHDPNTLSCYYMGEEVQVAGFAKHLLFEQSYPIIAVDVETISLKERIAIGVGIAFSPRTAFYFQLFPEESPTVPWHLLKNPAITKIFHNSLFDLPTLREFEVDNTNILDTNVMSRLLCYKYNNLVDLSFVHEMEVHSATDMIPTGGTMLNLEPHVVAKKCMQDAMATFKLYQEFIGRVDKSYLSV